MSGGDLDQKGDVHSIKSRAPCALNKMQWRFLLYHTPYCYFFRGKWSCNQLKCSALRAWLCPILLTFETDVARSRLYRSQSLQVNTHFAAFFKIYKIIGIPFLILLFFQIFCTVFTIFVAILQIFAEEHGYSDFFCPCTMSVRNFQRNSSEVCRKEVCRNSRIW